MNHSLLDRIIDPKLRAAAEACMGTHEGLAAKKSAYSSEGKLTAAGQRDALRSELPDALRKWTAAHRPIEKAAADLKRKREAVSIPTREPTDTAGAIADWEIRTLLKSMPATERAALLMSTGDERLLRAATNAPPDVIGFGDEKSKDLVDKVEARYLEMLHGDAIREIEEAEADIAEAEAAAQVARNNLAVVADMAKGEFEKIAGPIERGASAPWLIKSDNAVLVCEVDLNGTANYHSASPWELENGMFFKDRAEYDASRGKAA